ncbi:alpha-tectorin-like [Amphiura filiformis]|uniref:alpha-tectorin-like n=1 Tax=Amphiura filiformis TaxID=82378 RepID=UPI003B20BEB5
MPTDPPWYTASCKEMCICVVVNGAVEKSCSSIKCSKDAKCKAKSGTDECTCNPGYMGNGITCKQVGSTSPMAFARMSAGVRKTNQVGGHGMTVKHKAKGKMSFGGKMNGFKLGRLRRGRRSADDKKDDELDIECIEPLGLESGKVKDKHIKASTEYGTGYEAKLARLNNMESAFNSGGWAAAPDDHKPWHQLDLRHQHVLTGLMTQGHPSDELASWVTRYHVYTSVDGNNWVQMKDEDGKKQFHGNNDTDTPVTNLFQNEEAVNARYVRVNPTSSHNQAAMRMEVLGCPVNQPEIGYPVEKLPGTTTDNWSMVNSGNPILCNGYIKQWHYMPARMEPFKICVWRHASPTDHYVYRLISCTYVRATKPDQAYKIAVEPWIPVRYGDFIGVTFIRNPLNFTEDGEEDDECVWMNNNLIENFNELELGDTVRFDSKLNKCSFPVKGTLKCEDDKDVAALNCRDMLGLSDKEDIPTLAFTASSVSDDDNYASAHHARLSTPDAPNYSGWLPLPDDTIDPWLEVKLVGEGATAIVTGVITQCRGGDPYEDDEEDRFIPDTPSCVTQFSVAYSDDGFNFDNVEDENGIQIFDGNADPDEDVFSYFYKAVKCRFIRIYPISGRGLRFEVLGSDAPNPCAFDDACDNGATCIRKFMDPDGYVCKSPAGITGKKGEIQGEGFCRSVSNDHILTFDGIEYDFHGTCQYKMAASEEFKFEVIIDNNECGREVIVKIDDMVFVMKQEGVVHANGELCSLPIFKKEIKVSLSGDMGVMLVKEWYINGEWKGKLEVTWDGRHTVGVIVSPNFVSKVDGLCGNYNGDVEDDVAKDANGNIVIDSIRENVVDTSACPETKLLPVLPATQLLYGCKAPPDVLKKCEEFEKYPLAECNEKVDPSTYVFKCKYDMCLAPKTSYDVVLCNHLEEYATVCSYLGLSIAWRSHNRCSMQCKGNARHRIKGTACPATCGDAHAKEECTEPSMESCECAQGLVFDTISKECVEPKDCGCQDNGCYYARGKNFTRKGCHEKCECLGGGKVKCTPLSCGQNAHCGVSHATYECVCNDDFTGDGHTCDAITDEKTAASCANKQITISCSKEKKIDILSASITTNARECTAESKPSNLDTCCSDEGATLTVDKKCQGKSECIFEASGEELGEPCMHGNKYLSVKYHCTDVVEPEAEVKEVTNTACQGKKLDIDCGDKFINVISANYGRLSADVCKPKGDGAIKSTNCVYPTSLETVREKCQPESQPKSKCSIRASTNTFSHEDLCDGTQKYLEVKYQCTDEPQKASQASNPCAASKCKEGKCIRTKNGYTCQCKAGWTGTHCEHSLSTCSLMGLGHVHNFINPPFQMSSECKHTLLQACGEEGPHFKVEAKFERAGIVQQGYSAVEEVYLTYKGKVIELRQDGSVKVGGRPVIPTVNLGGITVKWAGSYKLVKTDFGLTIAWDGHHDVKITVRSHLAKQMCGLCGHYADDRDIGYHLRDGEHAPYPDKNNPENPGLRQFIGNWASESDKIKCTKLPELPDDACGRVFAEFGQDAVNYVHDQCSYLADEKGIFHSCLGKVPPKPYFKICMQDMCAGYPLDLEYRCETFAKYADACLAREVNGIANWRSVLGCTIDCPATMVYSALASGCPNTCGDIHAAETCKVRHYQGCECDEDSGLVREGYRCIPKEECGSVHQGLYYEVGREVIEEECKRQGHCAGTDHIIGWEPMFCNTKLHAFCGSRYGFYGCHCKEGYTGEDCHSENVFTAEISLGQTEHIDCGDDFIDINSASFVDANENCDAVGIIREQCQDRNRCRSVVMASNFGDGCTDASGLMVLEYGCSSTPTYEEDAGARKMVCDGKGVPAHLELDCGHKRIKIAEDSNYGRLEGSEVCPNGEILSTDCRWGDTVTYLKDNCENKKTCKVQVPPKDLVEDPCPGTSKYMEVHYNCVDPE